MKLKQTLASLVLLTAGMAASASAADISWNYDRYGTVSGSTQFAGVDSVANWNNSWPSNPTTNLIDSTGAATTLDIAYSSAGSWSVTGVNGPTPGQDANGTYNRNLLNGYLNSGSSTTPATSSITISQIPYTSYNLIVYFSSDVAGRTGTVSDGLTTYDFSTIGLSSVSGANAVLTQTTSTNSSNPTANYAIFNGLTGTTQTIAVNIPNFGGIAGFQVAVVPEPSTFALLGIGLAALVFLHRRAHS